MALKWLPLTASILILGGCCYPVRHNADLVVCDLASDPLDLTPLPPADQSGAMPPATTRLPEQPSDDSATTSLGPAVIDAGVVQAAAQGQRPAEPTLPPPRTLRERLEIPPGLPGADAPPLHLPPLGQPQERERAINRLYPPLPELGPEPHPVPGPDGHPLTLADLQRLAMSSSPVIRQAAAEVEANKGSAIQAGLYPNPNLGYEGDTLNQAASAGIQGAFIEQTIKTGGKLKLAQAAATMDVRNAQLALRRAQVDLATQVRARYFAVLVAQETVKVARALVRFTDEVYRVQVEQVRGAQAAAYEPLQLRVLAIQARGALVQAYNRHLAAWKQLAATLGLPAMPLTDLAGRVDLPIPVYDYDKTLNHVLTVHTDVLTAQNTAHKARYNLRFAQVTPIPDVDLRVLVQKDYTTPPFGTVTSVVLGLPVPIWNQNQGNIIEAQGHLLRALEESHRVRNELTSRLAEAFERYTNNRVLLDYYRDHILPDQVRAYRGVYEAHQQQPDRVSFGDIVNAQQTLATSITTYLTVLGNLWAAVVDVSSLVQTGNLFQVGLEPLASECVAPIPELPCCHPCSPLPDPALKGANGDWPPVAPGQSTDPMPAATEQ